MIECSTVAGKAQVLFYDDVGGKQIDEAVFEVVGEKKRFSLQAGITFIKSPMSYLYPTEYTKGDLVKIERYGGVYSHWGVYDENNCIYHLTGVKGPKQLNIFRIMGEDFYWCKVAYDNIKDVAIDMVTKKNNTRDTFKIPSNPDIIIERARRLFEEKFVQYSIKTSNCEHFATYCRYGEADSQQVANMVPKVLKVVLSITSIVVAWVVWKYMYM